MRNIIVLFLLVAAGVAVAQSAYRWVDEEGIVHYSDRPQEGASEINIKVDRPAQARQRSAQQPERSRPAAEAPPASFSYNKLSLLSPVAEETIWNNAGLLTVRLSLEPALRSGDQVRVYLDGQQQVVSGTEFQLQDVYRGSHSLQAEVVSAQDKLLIRSETRRFYVQQTSIAR